MGRKWLLYLPLALLAGCAQFPDLKHALKALNPGGPGAGPVDHSSQTQGQFNFDWILSGDRTIAPLQVFDNGRHTWLQFPAGAPVPAVFARQTPALMPSTAGITDRLLVLKHQGDFVVIDELPELLVFRGGHLQAEARRKQAVMATVEAERSSDQSHGLSPSSLVSASGPEATHAAPIALLPKVDQVMTASTTASVVKIGSSPNVEHDTSENGASLPLPVSSFTVSRVDGNLRQVLSRWAASSGWDFGPEHWMVDVDIPIIGTASFDLSFVDAVQALVSSTELADRPLQPCFYSNKVLRVVPYAQACNKVTAAVVSS